MCFLEEEQGNDLAAIQNSNYLIIRSVSSSPFLLLEVLILTCYISVLLNQLQ